MYICRKCLLYFGLLILLMVGWVFSNFWISLMYISLFSRMLLIMMSSLCACYTHLSVHLHISHIPLCMFNCSHIPIHVHTSLHTTHISVHLHTSLYMYTHPCTSTHIPIHVHTSLYIYTHLCTCIHISVIHGGISPFLLLHTWTCCYLLIICVIMIHH